MDTARGSALAIDHFPVPWAESLPQLLGSISYHFEHTSPRLSSRSWLGILSSHDSKHLPAKLEWQSALQSALLLAYRQGWGIMYAHETPYAEVVSHVAHRIGLSTCEVLVSSSKQSAIKIEDGPSKTRLILSSHLPSHVSKLPLHDRAVAFLADRVFGVHVRKNGKVAEILRKRLSHSAFPSGTVYIALTSEGVISKRASSDWMQQGGVGWIVSRQQAIDFQRSSHCLPTPTASTLVPTMTLRQWKNAEGTFLAHCTRARFGPWPDQSLMQFHDELLQRPWAQLPSVLETLVRILVQQRLVATTHLKRGNVKTVCFSAQPLDRLLQMRRFQSHLSRWDWEPYGMMIHREWLMEHGARQVQYLEASAAPSVNLEDQAFTQFLSKLPGDKEQGSHPTQDWTQEKEWRIADDVRLNQIPFSKAIVFVPTEHEARGIQHLSRWPIVITHESAT